MILSRGGEVGENVSDIDASMRYLYLS